MSWKIGLTHTWLTTMTFWKMIWVVHWEIWAYISEALIIDLLFSSKARIVTSGGAVSLQLHEHAREVRLQFLFTEVSQTMQSHASICSSTLKRSDHQIFLDAILAIFLCNISFDWLVCDDNQIDIEASEGSVTLFFSNNLSAQVLVAFLHTFPSIVPFLLHLLQVWTIDYCV